MAACALAPPPRPLPAKHPADVSAPRDVSASPAEDRRHFVDNALAMIGQPYRWGGALPGGFDCSGLVVYATAGTAIRLPRTAREQLGTGTPVARRELREGDLDLMRLKRKELHVGIVIDGGRFVHAPSTGGHVRIDALDARPYATAYVAARRVAGIPAKPGPRQYIDPITQNNEDFR